MARIAERCVSLRRTLDEPVDIAWLSAFRALFGAVMAFSMFRFLAYDWIDPFFVTPRFHFKYWGFAWVRPLDHTGMHAVFAALLVLALCVAAGFLFRLAAGLFVLGFAYLQLVDVTTYLNHYYLALLLGGLLFVSPAARAYSVDARSAKQAATHVPRFWLYLFRFQVGVVYTFAGLAKCHDDWLLHAQPLAIWLSSHLDMPLLGPLFRVDGVAMLMSWAGFLFDTSIPWLLMWSRVRPYAYVLVIVFHVLTRVLFPIGMFPVIMVVSALVFFPADWPRKLPLVRKREHAHIEARSTPHVRSLALGVATAWVLFQALMPVRFLAYGGNVRWHEQGMRWSWRVMVREKNGSVTFNLRQVSTGRRWYVSPSAYLTRLQEREMSGQPDLILQLAHHIRDDYAARGYGPVEVRVDATASLNGRRSARLIDPEVDLAAVPDGIARASWILPAPPGPPPTLRPI